MPEAWLKGAHRDYDMFVIEVLVRKDARGTLSSRRRLQSEQDERVAETMPSGGMVEGGWALLAEAARTEITLQLLVKLSNDPVFKEKFTRAETSADDEIEKLARDTTELIQRSLSEILPQVAREVTSIVRNGLRSQTE